MKKPKLSIQEQSLLTARNRAKSLWSFSNVRTRREILIQAFGYDPKTILTDSELPITFKEIDEIYEQELKRYKDSLAPTPIPASDQQEQTALQPITKTELVTEKDEPIPPSRIISVLERQSPYNPKPRKQKCDLLPKQIEAAKYIFDAIAMDHKHGLQLIGATGVGKTFVMGNVFLNLMEIGFFHGKSVSPWPIVCITKASIVEKTKRELLRHFGLDCDTDDVKVINVEQLRATFGEMYIKEETIVVGGEAHTKYIWKPNIHPTLFWWDENQVLKNDYSQQSRIGQAVNEIHINHPNGAHVYQVFASATPFTRVSEGKCFAVATRKPIRVGLSEQPITNALWPSFAKTIAAPADPYEYSPGAMEKFVTFFDDYIWTMKNVRSKYRANNSIQIITFRNNIEREFYEKAMERYEKEKAKLEESGASFMCILTELLKFRQAAEYIRTEYIADWIHYEISEGHKAPIAAVCFKETINRICWWLHKKYNYQRSDISIIWGGNTSQTKEDKEKFRKAAQAEALMSNKDLMKQFEDEGIDLDLLGLDLSESEKILVNKSPEELDFIKTFELGPQNPKQRQREIDRFQTGRSKTCLFTFKSGGVGLSLHHETPQLKPRTTILTPVYSAMEMVQGLGRAPRITSLSDTSQTVVFYSGTIEVHVAARVSAKLKCLQKAVRQREHWDDIILGEKYKTPEVPILPGEEEDDSDENTAGVMLEDEEEEPFISNPYINNLLL